MIAIDFGQQAWLGLNALGGAGLGASFYVLLRTQPYLLNRSYDPKYNAAYISRFITGLVGGVILATTLAPTLMAQSGPDFAKFSPGVLALLGGYSAEAVEQILQRLVEVLLSLVRGDASEQTQAKLTAEQTAKNVKVTELLPELTVTKADPAAFEATIQKIRAALKTTLS
jgi:hypothetical protein